MWKVVSICLGLAGCAPAYVCQTQFGQNPPLVDAAGVKYWPSVCEVRPDVEGEDEAEPGYGRR